ncbi:hypothetical protein KQX54_013053 [Cotesia glomerata]|uniref:ATP-dependent DNA helicase n=1 Tax=Cotesia glomerata TaxID=32391 RepID=A0AAV7IWE3_COTGL|nr:hypothetical protein KQX54_013053 [Cotesia glomerata]
MDNICSQFPLNANFHLNQFNTYQGVVMKDYGVKEMNGIEYYVFVSQQALNIKHILHSRVNPRSAKGDGNIPQEDGRIKVSCMGYEIVPELITLTDKIYPNIDKADKNCSSWLKERAILTPTNEQANCINNLLLEKISTE